MELWHFQPAASALSQNANGTHPSHGIPPTRPTTDDVPLVYPNSSTQSL